MDDRRRRAGTSLPQSEAGQADNQHRRRYRPHARRHTRRDRREGAGGILTITGVSRWIRLRCELRGSNGCWNRDPDVGHEAVAATTYRFDESGTLGGVPERLTDLVDRLVEPVVEVHEGVRGPQPLLKV